MIKISASELSEHSFCRKKAYLSRKLPSSQKPKESEALIKVKQAGVKKHALMQSKVQDNRCFVASWACGEDAEVTIFLRQFRDEKLLTKASGRLFVQLYYTLSPIAIFLLQYIPYAKKASSRMIRAFARIVGAKL